MASPPTDTILWPLGIYFVSVIIIVAAMTVLSHYLGERHSEKQTNEPYESGIVSTGTAQVRFDVKFYLIAMFFVIFDVESVFIFAWAVSVRDTGWMGFAEMMVFMGILVATLVYLWRIGALEWSAFVKHSTKYTVHSTK